MLHIFSVVPFSACQSQVTQKPIGMICVVAGTGFGIRTWTMARGLPRPRVSQQWCTEILSLLIVTAVRGS